MFIICILKKLLNYKTVIYVAFLMSSESVYYIIKKLIIIYMNIIQ